MRSYLDRAVMAYRAIEILMMLVYDRLTHLNCSLMATQRLNHRFASSILRHHLYPKIKLLLFIMTFASAANAQSLIKINEFIYQHAPFRSAHASTIVEVDGILVAAWFGGTAEGENDVGIWSSRHDHNGWSAPVEIANGLQDNSARFPSWNPVLFKPSTGPLLLFYKVGENPRTWWGLVKVSNDRGQTWSQALHLPSEILGPIRAKPVELQDGTLLVGSSTEHDGWVSHVERFKPPHVDNWNFKVLVDSDAWWRSRPLNSSATFDAIQPTILVHGLNKIQVLCRSRQGVITEAWSFDGGATWEQMRATELANPSAGIDALRLHDDRFLLVHNPSSRDRSQLAVSVFQDTDTWQQVLLLENDIGEYSYPAAIQTADNMVHITYTWRRERIKHVVIDPSQINN